MTLAVVAITAIIIVIAMRLYNKPHPEVATTAPVFTMEVSQLVDDFLTDEAKANADYGGKIVQLEGTLKEIVPNDSTVILMLGDTTSMVGVSAYLRPGEEVQDADLKPGERITVKGICDGMLMDVIVGNAILIREE